MSSTGSPGPDHAAGRPEAQLDHGAVGRRRDQRARQHVAARRQPLLDLGELDLDAAELLVGGLEQRGVLGDDLQLGLADRLLARGRSGPAARRGRPRCRRGALQREQPDLAGRGPCGRAPSSPSISSVDQRDLPAVGHDLGLEAGDLLAQLRDPLAQDALAVGERPGRGCANSCRCATIASSAVASSSVASISQSGKRTRRHAGLLGEQARLRRGQRCRNAACRTSMPGARLDVLEHDQRIAGLHRRCRPRPGSRE